jgi:hypothetical protein
VLAAFGFVLFAAASAQAAPSIDLLWRATHSSTLDTVVDGRGRHVLDVVLTADSTPVPGLSLSFLFDSDGANELDFVRSTNFTRVQYGYGGKFTPLRNRTRNIESEFGTGGLILGFDQSSFAQPVVNQSVTLGSVVFDVNVGRADGVDVQAVLGVNFLVGASGSRMADIAIFNGAQVVPEPTTATLVVLGFASLVWAGRKRGR